MTLWCAILGALTLLMVLGAAVVIGKRYRARTRVQFATQEQLEEEIATSRWLQTTTLSDADRSARKGRPSILSGADWKDFATEERQRLSRLCSAADEALESVGVRRRPRWLICKVDAAVENGYPFTIRSMIVLPESSVAAMSTETLLHELAHVIQRRDPVSASRMYVGRVCFGRDGAFPEMRYHSSRPAALAEASTVLINARSGKVVGDESDARRILGVPSYVRQAEHANEISAAVAARILASREDGNDGRDGGDGAWESAVRSWLKEAAM
jgi:hypothetical protein